MCDYMIYNGKVKIALQKDVQMHMYSPLLMWRIAPTADKRIFASTLHK